MKAYLLKYDYHLKGGSQPYNPDNFKLVYAESYEEAKEKLTERINDGVWVISNIKNLTIL